MTVRRISPAQLASRVGQLRVGGGIIRLPASDIDFAGYYTFEEDIDGKTYRWMDIRPVRDGDEAVFYLESQPA